MKILLTALSFLAFSIHANPQISLPGKVCHFPAAGPNHELFFKCSEETAVRAWKDGNGDLYFTATWTFSAITSTENQYNIDGLSVNTPVTFDYEVIAKTCEVAAQNTNIKGSTTDWTAQAEVKPISLLGKRMYKLIGYMECNNALVE